MHLQRDRRNLEQTDEIRRWEVERNLQQQRGLVRTGMGEKSNLLLRPPQHLLLLCLESHRVMNMIDNGLNFRLFISISSFREPSYFFFFSLSKNPLFLILSSWKYF